MRKQDKLSFLKFPGSKLRFVDLINEEILKTKDEVDIYCEPFLGSGAIFLNLPFKFKNYYISDFDRNVIQIWNTFKYEYESLLDFYEREVCIYGNPGRIKEVYFKVRDELNEKYFLSNTKEESFYLFSLSRNVINSILRFGKRGINTGWGNRGYDLNIDKLKFDKLKNLIFNDICELSVLDIFSVFNRDFIDSNKTLLFLDPPYTELAMSYKGEKNYKVDFDKYKYLDKIKNLKSKIIYTDVYNEDINRFLNWRIVDIRMMTNIRPGSSCFETKKEVMYINF
jgi:site-specific DNA-adenine methylase